MLSEYMGKLEAGVAMTRPPLDELRALRREHRDAMRCIAILADAVAFYADPQQYHAISILVDRPAGGFADDFSRDHGDDFYNRPMPGKYARKAIKRHNAIIAKYARDSARGAVG